MLGLGKGSTMILLELLVASPSLIFSSCISWRNGRGLCKFFCTQKVSVIRYEVSFGNGESNQYAVDRILRGSQRCTMLNAAPFLWTDHPCSVNLWIDGLSTARIWAYLYPPMYDTAWFLPSSAPKEPQESHVLLRWVSSTANETKTSAWQKFILFATQLSPAYPVVSSHLSIDMHRMLQRPFASLWSRRIGCMRVHVIDRACRRAYRARPTSVA